MCGTSVFKFDDFKSHTAINGAGASFYKVVSWFWAIVSDFTQEEMARYDCMKEIQSFAGIKWKLIQPSNFYSIIQSCYYLLAESIIRLSNFSLPNFSI